MSITNAGNVGDKPSVDLLAELFRGDNEVLKELIRRGLIYDDHKPDAEH